MLDRSCIKDYNYYMNRKSISERTRIVQLLVEGNSLRSTSRIADCSINTVTKILIQTGAASGLYQDSIFFDLPCKNLQVDEIWSFVYAKSKNVRDDMPPAGNVWTWTAICADTKLVPTWRIGSRDAQTAKEFIADLAPRMRGRVQLTSDGFSKYKDAVEESFGADIDYSMLIKQYDENQRYIGALKSAQIGQPDNSKITTAHVERQNLTMRMSIKRFARKTNAFSKKIENHCHAISLHFMYYNFCRIHKSLRISPAMAAGVTDRLWSIEDVVSMTDGK